MYDTYGDGVELRCRRESNPTSPPKGRQLWVPLNAVQMERANIDATVCHSHADWKLGLRVQLVEPRGACQVHWCGTMVDSYSGPACEVTLRVRTRLACGRNTPGEAGVAGGYPSQASARGPVLIGDNHT